MFELIKSDSNTCLRKLENFPFIFCASSPSGFSSSAFFQIFDRTVFISLSSVLPSPLTVHAQIPVFNSIASSNSPDGLIRLFTGNIKRSQLQIRLFVKGIQPGHHFIILLCSLIVTQSFMQTPPDQKAFSSSGIKPITFSISCNPSL